MPERAMQDELLGTLTWNESLDWWEGQAELSHGHLIRFSITVEHEDELTEEEIGHARRLLLRLQEHEPEARVVAAEELLEIYNDEWNEGDPLDEEEFMSRLTLDDLNVAPDGSAELFYRDDGLFAGHTVLVSIGTDGNFDDADIAG